MHPQLDVPEGGASPEDDAVVPSWFDVLALVPPTLLATVGVAGLGLAVAGVYSTVAALAIGVPVAAAAVWAALWRGRVRRPGGPSLPALAACAIALAYAVFAAWAPSEHVLVNRDPASYAETARWLARDGSLEADAAWGGLEATPDLRYTSSAVYGTGAGHLEFQFNHLTSVGLAAGYDIGGPGLLFRIPAVLAASGLLCLYAVAARATGRRWTALIAPGALALTAPLLYVARDTYSEPGNMLLLWGAVLVLLMAHRRPTLPLGALGGFLLGATTAARVDSLYYVALAVPICALSVLSAGTHELRRRRLAAYLAGAATGAVAAAVGWMDLEWRTGNYARDLAGNVGNLRVLLAASLAVTIVGAVVWLRWAGVRRAVTTWAPKLSGAVAGLVGVVLLLGWVVRPLVQTTRAARVLGLVEGIQHRDGLVVDGTRRYAEQSIRWMAWYLGPLGFATALGGIVVGVRRSLRGSAGPALVVVVVLCLVTGGPYWWDPHITPTQLWATRRFVPAVLPALTIMSAVLVGWLVGGRLGPRWARVAVGASVAAIVVLGPLGVTRHIHRMSIQFGFLDVVEETCDLVGPDATIVVTGGYATRVVPQALRGWCGVPVASARNPAKGGTAVGSLAAVARAAAAQGRELYLVSTDPASFEPYSSLVDGPVLSTSVGFSGHEPIETVDRAPTRYAAPRRPQMFAVRLTAGGG